MRERKLQEIRKVDMRLFVSFWYYHPILTVLNTTVRQGEQHPNEATKKISPGGFAILLICVTSTSRIMTFLNTVNDPRHSRGLEETP